MAVREGLTKKVEQPNIIAKKCKIEISGKKNFWQGPEMGTGKMLTGTED